MKLLPRRAASSGKEPTALLQPADADEVAYLNASQTLTAARWATDRPTVPGPG
jgi:hypothetical protein